MRQSVHAISPEWARHGYRPDVDGLRALAVLLVLGFHAGLPLFGGGFIGVDVFFVVSGYLITRNILADVAAGSFSFRSFFLRRAFRLLPASFVVIALTLVAGIMVLPQAMLQNLGQSALFAALSVSNVFFWRDVGYFALANEFKPLLHTWSLAVEDQFYLLYPPFLLALTALARSRFVRVGWLLVVCLGSTLAAEWLLARGSASAAFYLMPLRAGEFAIGAVVALLPARALWTDGWRSNAAYAAGLALVLAPAMLFTSSTPFPGVLALVPAAGTGLMIYAGGASAVARPLRSRPAVAVGLMSYSIYLVHWPLMVFYEYLSAYPLQMEERLALIVLSIALAYPLYVGVERPFRIHGALPEWRAISRRLIGIGAACAACQIAGVVAWRGISDEWRYSPQSLREITTAQTVPGPECTAEVVAKDPTKIRCTHFEGRKGSALLLGDSHAEHFRPALAAALAQAGYTLDHYGGCVPLPGVRKLMDGREDEACTGYAARIERMVDAYDVIAIAARWSLYTETTIGAHEKGTIAKSYVLTDGSGAPLTPEHATAVFSERLERFLTTLMAKGKTVLLIGQVPELGIDLTPCLGRPDWHGLLPITTCEPFYDRTASLARLAFTDAELLRLGGGRPGISLFLPSVRMCPEGQARCDVRKDGRWLYRDDDHLNARGAMAFVPELTAALKPLVDTEAVATSALSPR